MARYVDAVDLPISIEKAFDYLADFSRTAEWDPSVFEARRLTRGRVGLGSSFRVTVSILGRHVPFEYEITEFERPSRLVLSGGDSSIRSTDEITFVSRPSGTRVTYEARLELVGNRRLTRSPTNECACDHETRWNSAVEHEGREVAASHVVLEERTRKGANEIS